MTLRGIKGAGRLYASATMLHRAALLGNGEWWQCVEPHLGNTVEGGAYARLIDCNSWQQLSALCPHERTYTHTRM